MPEDLQRALALLFLMVGLIVIGLLLLSQYGCLPPGSGIPATYEAELISCTNMSSTLCESIACEQKVRAAYHRPPRTSGVPAECGDGGVK